MFHKVDTGATYAIRRKSVKRKGMCSMEKEQKIRMCIQTYVNLYGIAPSAQELLEWLGTSCDDRVLGYLNQKQTT